MQRRAACWQSIGGQNKRAHPRHRREPGGGLGGVLGACGGVGGGVRGPWPCHWHARITQRRRVGELEPEAYFLGVSGQFHDLVKRRIKRDPGFRLVGSGVDAGEPQAQVGAGHGRLTSRRLCRCHR